MLGKMAHYHFVSIQTVPGCIGVGEAIKGVAVAGFDGIEPSFLDWKAQIGMICWETESTCPSPLVLSQ